MTRLLLLLALTLGASAQSGVSPYQIRGPMSSQASVLVVLPSGFAALAIIEPPLYLDTSTAPPRLKVMASPALQLPIFVVGESPTRASDLVYKLAAAPLPGTLAVYRNGLLQKEGLDYSVAGTLVSFIPYYAGEVDALVLVSYHKSPPTVAINGPSLDGARLP